MSTTRIPSFLAGYNGHAPDMTASGTVEEAHSSARELLGLRPHNRVNCRVGQRLGQLTIMKILPPEGNNGNSCVCRCECGEVRKVLAWRLVHGEVIDCKRCGQIRRMRQRGHKPDLTRERAKLWTLEWAKKAAGDGSA